MTGSSFVILCIYIIHNYIYYIIYQWYSEFRWFIGYIVKSLFVGDITWYLSHLSPWIFWGDPQHPGCTRKIEYDGYGPMVVTGTDGNPGCLGRGPVLWPALNGDFVQSSPVVFSGLGKSGNTARTLGNPLVLDCVTWAFEGSHQLCSFLKGHTHTHIWKTCL